ncbi:MAG: hypothetical protein DMG82_14415 [Acidobacteria bacterium]|nr:MAG: hypothetical protein DMG82_14415 [Acidobacteriota bacterium]
MQSDYSNILWMGTGAFGTVMGKGKVLNRRERRERPQRTQKFREKLQWALSLRKIPTLTSQRTRGEGGALTDDLVLRS